MVAALPFLAAGASAIGDIGGGAASAQAAGYQSQVAKNNAIISSQNASYAASAGAAQTEEASLKARADSADIKAGEAANNLDVNTGSAADVATSAREVGGLDTATVANRAAEQVYGYTTQAQDYGYQSKVYSAEEAPDIAGGFLKAAGGLAGAAPSIPGGPSTISGSPSVPNNYAWMQTGDTTAEPF